MAALFHAVPVNGVRDGCWIRRAIVEGVGDVEHIADMLIGDAHRCRSRSQVDLHGAGWDAHGPKQAIGIGEDTGVEVVDLGREIREVKLTFKDI